MPDANVANLNPDGTAPETRIKDATSLNGVVKKLIEADGPAAVGRVSVQKMYDGEAPFIQSLLDNSGQAGRCNINFLDGKNRIKLEAAGYYDLTNSVPTLAFILTDGGDPTQRTYYNHVMSEEFHRLLTEWTSFDSYYQLLVQKFCTHGLGFLYFPDDADWRWRVAGLEDFKLPRNASLTEDDVSIATVLREVPIEKAWGWIKDMGDNDKDGRWNIKEVRAAIMKATDSSLVYSDGSWGEFWQTKVKNNDLGLSVGAETIKVAYAWVKEFSGKLSFFLTLQDGSNQDFLFKVTGLFDSTDQCFTYFPYEVGTNGTLHSVRGKAHEIYPIVQVLNSMRCKSVDNANISGSMILQPKTAEDAQDLTLIHMGGYVYIPPGVNVQSPSMSNASQNVLPVIRDMQMSLRGDDVNTRSPEATQREKTKFEVQGDMARESVLPTAALNLFYGPWGRHLSEVWRRAKKSKEKGAAAMRKRIKERGVPDEAFKDATRVVPMRAVGYGSPTNRLMAFDELMQYYGSLDPVGQNNLLRDRFALRVTYGQVDRYVPAMSAAGRQPLDTEIAALQNSAMSYGQKQPVIPNDMHIIHLQTHLPNIEVDLEALESGAGTPMILGAVQLKINHIAEHMKLLKPDKLTEKVVAGLSKEFNNVSQRVEAAMEAAERQAEEQPPQGQPDPKLEQAELAFQQKTQHREQAHEQKLQQRAEDADQRRAIKDTDTATHTRAMANRARILQLSTQPTGAGTPTPAAPPVEEAVGA